MDDMHIRQDDDRAQLIHYINTLLVEDVTQLSYSKGPILKACLTLNTIINVDAPDSQAPRDSAQALNLSKI
jgi:hypothetical protein